MRKRGQDQMLWVEMKGKRWLVCLAALGVVVAAVPSPASAAFDCAGEEVCEIPPGVCDVLSDWGDFVAKVIRELSGSITLVTESIPHYTDRTVVAQCATIVFKVYADGEYSNVATGCGDPNRVPACAGAPGAALLFDDPLTQAADDWGSSSDGIWCGPGTCVAFRAGTFKHEAEIIKYTAAFKVDVRGEAHARYYQDNDGDGTVTDDLVMHQVNPITVHYTFLP